MVDITDITTGVVQGEGYFDKFMDAINAQLKSQLVAGNIQSTDFANVYLGAMQTALAQAVAYVQAVEQVNSTSLRTAAEVALLEQKTKTEEAQIKNTLTDGTVVYDSALNIGYGAVGKQGRLQQAQVDAFSRDAEQKALKILMDAWQVSKSVTGDSLAIPDGAQNDDIEDLIIKLRQGVGVTDSIYKFNADAGLDANVIPGTFVTLDGSNSTFPGLDTDAGEVITGYLWTQVSPGGGTSVGTITNMTSAVASFVAPAISGTASDNSLIFQLEITGSAGTTDTDTVTFTVG